MAVVFLLGLVAAWGFCLHRAGRFYADSSTSYEEDLSSDSHGDLTYATEILADYLICASIGLLGLVGFWVNPRWYLLMPVIASVLGAVACLWAQPEAPIVIFPSRMPGYVMLACMGCLVLSGAMAAWARYRGSLGRLVPESRILCTQCSYDLTGNVSGRCPECGAPVVAGAELSRERA